jgi:hypothetical protein
MRESDGRARLYIRLGKSRRDRKLAAYIAADMERGVNVSKLAKELLYNYYTGSSLPTHAGPVVTEPNEDTRQVALSAKLKKLSFDSLSRQ